MANAGLVFIGILLVGGMFFFSNVMIDNPEQIELAASACDTSAGEIGQALSGTIAENCNKAQTYSMILGLKPIVYIVGGLLFLIGLVVGRGGKTERKVEKKIVHTSEDKGKTSRKIKEESKETESDEGKESEETSKESKEDKSESKYCTNCGAEVGPDHNYCPECGEEVKWKSKLKE